MQLLIRCLAVIASCYFVARGNFDSVKACGSFFKPESGYANEMDQTESMMFKNIYHQCGLNQDCMFVAMNIIDDSYKIISNDQDLPRDKENNKVWRKIPEKMRSCSDWYKCGAVENGVYPILDLNNSAYPVFCDFQSEKNSTWTLLMSFSLQNVGSFKDAMMVDSPRSDSFPNWKSYRLGKSRITNLKSMSKLWRATCDFPIYGIDYRDYLRAAIRDVDLLGNYNGQCKRVQYIDIEGRNGYEAKVPFYQQMGEYPMHVDISHVDCGFSATRGWNEDHFGFYEAINQNFRCTQTQQSTTQYWFGDGK